MHKARRALRGRPGVHTILSSRVPQLREQRICSLPLVRKPHPSKSHDIAFPVLNQIQHIRIDLLDLLQHRLPVLP